MGMKITNREMGHIALFENITGATVRDCIIDDEYDRIIFIIKEGDAGIAIGKKGKNIAMLQKMTGKRHEVIEFSENPEVFIKNALKPADINEIRLSERPNGKKIAIVSVNPKDKGIAIGKNGSNIKKIRFLANRYFQLDTVVIN